MESPSPAPTAAAATPHAAGPSKPPGKRARNRSAVEADILRVAREHLAHEGAAALSLRAIARHLGMVSSGIYRYVDSRDELLTRLIVDSFSSLAAAVREAHDAVPRDQLEARWDAVGRSLRDWARRRPHDFALVYGSPVPDYEAPPERTVESGTAVLTLLVRLLVDTREAGRLADSGLVGVPESAAASGVGPLLGASMFDDTGLDPVTLAQGIAAWTLLLGAVTSEVFAQLGPLPDAEALFECLLAVSRRCIIAPPETAAARR